MLFIDGESKMDLSEYVQSPEWLVILIHVSLLSIKFYLRNIIEAPGYKNIKLFDNKNITIMTYNLILRRNGGFISYILIVPCILMAILTMVCIFSHGLLLISRLNRLCFGYRLKILLS